MDDIKKIMLIVWSVLLFGELLLAVVAWVNNPNNWVPSFIVVTIIGTLYTTLLYDRLGKDTK